MSPASGRWAKLRRLLFYVYDYSLYTLNFVNKKKQTSIYEKAFLLKNIKRFYLFSVKREMSRYKP